MERDEVRLRLEGEIGRIEAKALLQGLDRLVRLLDRAAAPETERPACVISQLASRSTDVVIRPAGVVTREALDGMARVAAGVEQLAEQAGIPDGWDQAMIRLLLEIGDVTHYLGVEGASLQWADHQPVRVDREVRVRAEPSPRDSRQR